MAIQVPRDFRRVIVAAALRLSSASLSSPSSAYAGRARSSLLRFVGVGIAPNLSLVVLGVSLRGGPLATDHLFLVDGRGLAGVLGEEARAARVGLRLVDCARAIARSR